MDTLHNRTNTRIHKNGKLAECGEAEQVLLNKHLPGMLIDWYEENARTLPWRADQDPYHVWISEIMLQQTRVETVKAYYIRFLKEVPNVSTLASIEEERLLKLWEGLGYYSRARNLKKAAQMIITEYEGVFPDQYEQILKLPGIGSYTAGAIASICFGQPTPAVDGNVLRVITRIAAIYENIDLESVKNRIRASLSRIYPKNQSSVFTQSLMELGAVICVPNGIPKCTECPVASICNANRKKCAMELPVRSEKKEKKIQDITVLYLLYKKTAAIRCRKKKGLLAGMWEFPNIDQKLSAQQAVNLAEEWSAQPVSLIKSIERTHIFTHIRWNMTCYYIECNGQPDHFVWADYCELSEKYALPTAFKMFIDNDIDTVRS